MPESICFPLPPKLRAITLPKLDAVLNYYVYEWHDNGIPFYVGYGCKRKAWNEHNIEAEETKLLSREFRVVIVEDNLTKLRAQDIKRYLIHKYREQEKMYLANLR